MLNPGLEAVEGQRFEVGVELVDEELLPIDETRKIFDAEHTDAAYHLTEAGRLVPVGVYSEPWLVLWMTYNCNACMAISLSLCLKLL